MWLAYGHDGAVEASEPPAYVFTGFALEHPMFEDVAGEFHFFACGVFHSDAFSESSQAFSDIAWHRSTDWFPLGRVDE